MPRRSVPLWSDPGEVDDALDGAELLKDLVERCTALRPEGERAAHKVVAVAGIGVQLQLRERAVLLPREADELPEELGRRIHRRDLTDFGIWDRRGWKNDDDGEISYDWNMSILSEDIDKF